MTDNIEEGKTYNNKGRKEEKSPFSSALFSKKPEEQTKEKISVGEKKHNIKLKTMKRDLARLRLEEAEKERKKIIELQEKEGVAVGKPTEVTIEEKEKFKKMKATREFQETLRGIKEKSPFKTEKKQEEEQEEIRTQKKTTEEPTHQFSKIKHIERERVELLKERNIIESNLSSLGREIAKLREDTGLLRQKEENQTYLALPTGRQATRQTPEDRQATKTEIQGLEEEQRAKDEKKKEQKERFQQINKKLKDLDLGLDRLKLEEDKVVPSAEKRPDRPREKQKIPQLGIEEKLKQAEERMKIFKEQKEQREEKKEEGVDKIGLEKQEAKKELKDIRERIKKPGQEIFEKQVEVLEPLPPKPSEKQKRRSRGLVIGLSVVILSVISVFVYWFLFVKKGTITPPAPPSPPSDETEPPEVMLPSSFVSIEQENILELSTAEELPNLLSELLKKDLGENQFTRIIIKEKTRPHFLGLREFLNSFEVKMPAGLLDALEDNPVLFIYSADGQNRFGLIAKTQEEKNIPDLMFPWEPSIENDTEGLFQVIGKEESGNLGIFKTAKHEGVFFRYSSFPQENLGICWAAYKGYLILTSSGAAITETIELLQSTPPELEKQSEAATIAWNIFQEFLNAFDARDADKMNTLAYKPDFGTDIEDCLSEGMEEDACWEITGSFPSTAIDSKLKISDFTSIEQDENQIIVSTNWFFEETLEPGNFYSKSFIYLIKNPQGKVLLLELSKLDSYEDVDIKDSDGDGWWDGIEVKAKTNPNDADDYPYSSQ